MLDVTIEQFRDILPGICARETSYNPRGWSPENPLQGHCAVVALLAQDLFGGELLRGSLERTVYASMRWHYWNRLPDGTEVDFTREQFRKGYPDLDGQIRPRSLPLRHRPTKERYERLREALERPQSL